MREKMSTGFYVAIFLKVLLINAKLDPKKFFIKLRNWGVKEFFNTKIERIPSIFFKILASLIDIVLPFPRHFYF